MGNESRPKLYRNIKKIRVPRDIYELEKRLVLPSKRLLIGVGFVLGFCHDAHFEDRYSEELRKELEKFLEFEELHSIMKDEFFQKFYVYRSEIIELKAFTSKENKVHIVVGPRGVGKTTLLLKVKNDFYESPQIYDCYLDFDELIDQFNYDYESISEEQEDTEFNKRADQIIFHDLDDFINNSGWREDWVVFKVAGVKTDKGYKGGVITFGGLKRAIRDNYSPSSKEDWLRYLRMPQYSSVLSDINLRVEEAGELCKYAAEFISKRVKLIVMLDNCDRLPFNLQYSAYRYAMSLASKAHIHVIFVARDTTLNSIRRIIQRKKGDFGVITITTLLELLKPFFKEDDEEEGESDRREENDTFIRQQGPEGHLALICPGKSTLDELMKKRIDLLKEWMKPEFIEDFFNLINELRDADEAIDFQEFCDDIFRVIRMIAKTLISDEIQEKCNSSIRNILVDYFNFTYKMVLNPEENYRLQDFLQLSESERRIRIRTYFYKWCICRDKAKPEEDKVTNIFENKNMIDLKILESLYNWEKVFPETPSTFKNLSVVFDCFGVDKKILRDRLIFLSRDNNDTRRGFISLDLIPDGKGLLDNTIVELREAGWFFVNKLSVSREYVFWQSLTTPIAEKLIKEEVNLSETTSDNYKLGIVLKFVEKVLLKRLDDEIKELAPDIVPDFYDGSINELYRDLFSIGSWGLYLRRFLLKTRLSINRKQTNLNGEEEKTHKKTINRILNKIDSIIKKIH